MKLDRFDFTLARELIANHPADPRDSSKILEVSESLKEHIFRDITQLINPKDILVFNNTKVIPAKLTGKCGDATIRVNLHKKLPGNRWKVFAKPGKKLKPGLDFVVNDEFKAKIIEKFPNGEVVLEFDDQLMLNLIKYGDMPIPPYIDRKPDVSDRDLYQTVFAEKEGAVAAPTAGLHFTKELMEKIKASGIKTAYVTLHVGAGTFLPVKAENIEEHVMHSEEYFIDQKTADAINEAKSNGGRVIAVGTTSLRVLESVAENGRMKAGSGDTDIFIYPGYEFKIVDALITNFHLPKSTLFMLVCAFAGEEKMKQAYQFAIENKYRFFSYGDANFLYRDKSAV